MHHHARPFLVGLLAFAACAAPGGDAGAAGVPAPCELVVLGVAQDGGLPHVGCDRPCCATARANGRVLWPSSLGVVDRVHGRLLLVEATPRIEEQLALLHTVADAPARGRAPVDAVLVTHAHIGHYLGLAHFGREVAATHELPVFGSPRFCAFLRGNGPWRQLVELHQVAPRELAFAAPTEIWPGLTVTAIPVPHRDEYSDTMAYVLRGPERAVLFVPDVDAWERAPGLLERLLDGVDTAYVDGTFYDGSELPERNLAEIRHPLMTRTMDLLAGIARARPGAIRFLHLNHTNPALHDPAIAAAVAARGFAIAATGERVRL